MSEGTFSFSFLFSSATPEAAKEQKKATKWASASADPWGAGRDLPSLLEQVSLKGRQDSGGMFCDDTATLPRRRVNLFSSLRLRKREGSVSEGPDQEIRTILTNLRNKGWCTDSQPHRQLSLQTCRKLFWSLGGTARSNCYVSTTRCHTRAPGTFFYFLSDISSNACVYYWFRGFGWEMTNK